jgi:hypothetical protein
MLCILRGLFRGCCAIHFFVFGGRGAIWGGGDDAFNGFGGRDVDEDRLVFEEGSDK